MTNYIPSHFREHDKGTAESNQELISSSKEDIVQTDRELYTAKNLTPEPNQENVIQTAKEAELEHNGSEEKSIIQKQTQNHSKDNNGIPAITKPAVSKPPVIASSVTFLVESGQKPVQANIFIDNNYIGKTDNSGKIEIHDLTINETYKVKVTREGYSSYTDEIKVKESNSTRKVSITPIKQNVSTGTLILDAIPVADEIYIDGILHQGKTPTRIAIEQGKHTVKLVNNAVNADYEQTVDLKVKQIVRIKHDFTKLQSGQVAVTLENAAQFGFGYVYVDDNLWHEKNNTTPLQITLPTGSHKIALRRPGFKATPEEITVTVERDKIVTAAFKFVQVE